MRLEGSRITKDRQNTKLDDFKEIDQVTKKAKEIATRYVNNGFENTKNWIAYLGQSGSGKTLLSIAIAMELLNKERPPRVVYMPYLDSMRELKASAMDDENYMSIQQKFLKADLLIIDDLFKDKSKNGKLIKYGQNTVELSESDIRHINPILNYRYFNKKNTIINSECTLRQLIELDEALAGRIFEICCNGKTVVEFKGTKYNYRFRNLETVN